MKLIFTELGNPELCMNITVNIPKALAEELLRACRTLHSLAIEEWERPILAHLPCQRLFLLSVI